MTDIYLKQDVYKAKKDFDRDEKKRLTKELQKTMTKPHNDKLSMQLTVKGSKEIIETVTKYVNGEITPEECGNNVGFIMMLAMKHYAEEVQLT